MEETVEWSSLSHDDKKWTPHDVDFLWLRFAIRIRKSFKHPLGFIANFPLSMSRHWIAKFHSKISCALQVAHELTQVL